MKYYIKLALLFIFYSFNGYSQITNNLTLVWSDEFNGTSLDTTKWAPAPEWPRQGGSFWSDDNYEMTGNGQVKLKVTEVDGKVYCGAIRTHNKFDQKYGYFETRCKLPEIQGGWAAFWLMPYGNKPGSWGNDGTEMDVFESINGWNGKINHALHWDGYGAEHQKESQSTSRPDLYDNQYHTFGMMWTPDEYVFYIDNIESWRTSAGGVSDVKQYLKLTLEVSGDTWAGNWNNQVTKPINWLIDYVRVYNYQPIVSIPVSLDFRVLQANQTFNVGDQVQMHIDVSGTLSQIDEIRFYTQKGTEAEILRKTSNINSETTYWYNWLASDAGVYKLKAKGYKNGTYVTNAVVNATINSVVTSNPLSLSFGSLNGGDYHNVGDKVNMDVMLSGDFSDADEIQYLAKKGNGEFIVQKTTILNGSSTYGYDWTANEVGSYTLRVTAFKNGQYVTHVVVGGITVEETLNPLSLSFTVLENGQTYNVGDEVKIEIEISGDLSKVDEIRFISEKIGRNSTILKTSYTESNVTTYSFNWTPADSGSYLLKVLAFKNNAYVTTAVVTMTVKDPLKLTFRVLEDGQTYTVVEEIKMHIDLTGNISEADEIKFFAQLNGGTNVILKTETNLNSTVNVYWFKWLPTESGNYTFKASAYKNGIFISNVTAVVTVNDIVTEIQEYSNNSGLLAYPNPTTGMVSLNIESEFNYVVLDLTGKLKLKGDTQLKTSSIDLSSLVQGNYILHVTTQKNKRFFKITKN